MRRSSSFIPWVERTLWALIIGGLSLGIYFGYRFWDETQNASVKDVRYTSSVITYWQDTRYRPPLPTAHERRLTQLAQGKLSKKCEKIAELTIPRLGITYPIYSAPEGTEKEMSCLRKGAILLNRGDMTAYPGDRGLTVLSGHNDTQFRALEKLVDEEPNKPAISLKQTGETAIMNDGRTLHVYQFRKAHIASATADIIEKHHGNQSVLYLTTCYPFHMLRDTPHRAVLALEMVDQKPSQGFQYKEKV